MKRCNRSSGVTLIEMLAVIVIIGIVSGLILPAIQKARQRGKGIKAQAELSQLKIAWRSYMSTYLDNSRVNIPSGNITMGPQQVRRLSGAYPAGNPNMIGFMEFPAEAESQGFLDPWGQPYRVSIGNIDTTDRTKVYVTRVYPALRNSPQ